jgi:hypothetical protein
MSRLRRLVLCGLSLLAYHICQLVGRRSVTAYYVAVMWQWTVTSIDGSHFRSMLCGLDIWVYQLITS